MGEEEDPVVEEATGASSIPVCLMSLCSACMEGQATPLGTQAPEAPLGTVFTQSPCRLSLCPLCLGREEPASSLLLYPQHSA